MSEFLEEISDLVLFLATVNFVNVYHFMIEWGKLEEMHSPTVTSNDSHLDVWI